MSHDQQDNPPAWAMALIERLQALESQQQQQHQQQPGSNADESMEESINDPFISTRSPETDLHLYPEFKAALPGVDQDFFRRPLPEAERRRFLADSVKPNGLTANWQTSNSAFLESHDHWIYPASDSSTGSPIT
ncbi:predicted protein [Lichtheimia corymbifera JMRC:FSU:9682]|uniref:Uncharacterized protein n=1 Tax=Lichtheimia corymbifera JMRC:FSU:9682 TaxID=1263082 RepID=A0A068S0H9_9FUNG|nr:predicted protein [Lichtheimia corymbifera JMRC:FSU:9682]